MDKKFALYRQDWAYLVEHKQVEGNQVEGNQVEGNQVEGNQVLVEGIPVEDNQVLAEDNHIRVVGHCNNSVVVASVDS